MRFYEYEAKVLLGRQGVPLPKSGNAKTPQEAEEIAAISDGLLLPTDADDFIEKHREDTGGGAKPL